MSAGGVFKLIANDGKADAMIMATELLNTRIKEIMCLRAAQGAADPTPTLVDIERTHILFINSHFKPFAAIAYEYNKVRTNTGTAQFGGSVQYSIPQFGDFFNDMVINTVLSEAQATVGTVPAFPAYIGPDDQVTTASASISAEENPGDGVYTQYTYEYVDLQGNVLNTGSAAQNFVRYAEFIGQRLFKRVYFNVNGNPLDDYTSEAVNFFQKFRVPPHKMVGWKRLVGQEVPITGYSDLLSISGTTNYGAASANLDNQDGQPAAGSSVNSSNTARKVITYVDGPQTPKLVQPVLDMWIPLIYWFNQDPRLSIASVSIPYGQRFITIDIEQQNNVLFVAPGNLFLRLTVLQTTSAGAGAGTAAALAVESVQKYVTLTPVLAQGSVISQNQQISFMDLYINNIFVNPEIHDIYIKRIGFSLIRVHRTQNNREAVAEDSVLMAQLKWPTETMYVGLRPAWNINALNPNQYRDWHHLALLQDHVVDQTSNASAEVMIDNTVAWNAVSVMHKYSNIQQSVERGVYPTQLQTIDTLRIKAHGVSIYDQYKSAFFRDYMAYTYGGTNIVTPEDIGALMVNFCLYPGTYQPSGHLNISRARETYLDFTSSYVDSAHPADLIVIAKAINFLLISDGSAVLRYTT